MDKCSVCRTECAQELCSTCVELSERDNRVAWANAAVDNLLLAVRRSRSFRNNSPQSIAASLELSRWNRRLEWVRGR